MNSPVEAVMVSFLVGLRYNKNVENELWSKERIQYELF